MQRVNWLRRLAEILGLAKPLADTVSSVAGATPVGDLARAASVVSGAANSVCDSGLCDSEDTQPSVDAAAARAGTAAGAAANHASHIAGRTK